MFTCLRCGWCCIVPKVPIIKPEFKDTKIRIDKSFLYFDKIIEKQQNTPCPHLTFNDRGQSSCIVHDKEWYETTRCYYFKTIEIDISISTPNGMNVPIIYCPIGKYVKSNFPKIWWKTWWEYIPVY